MATWNERPFTSSAATAAPAPNRPASPSRSATTPKSTPSSTSCSTGRRTKGIVIAADDGEPGMARELIDRLGERGIWLPVVIAAPSPTTEQVVAAIKAGALDYLRAAARDGQLRAAPARASSPKPGSTPSGAGARSRRSARSPC